MPNHSCDVLLINPPWSSLLGSPYAEIPLGVAYLASYLRARDVGAVVYNADYAGNRMPPSHGRMFDAFQDYKSVVRDAYHSVWRAIAARASDLKPRLVGIHAKTSSVVSALNVASAVKAAVGPCVKIVLGGPHATIVPEETCAHQNVDFVIVGEGEETLFRLWVALKQGDDLGRIEGLAWKRNGTIVVNPPRPLFQSLDSLPFPERECIVDAGTYPKDAFGLIMTARGCPFQCTYCASHKVWGRKVRYRSAGSVLGEMRYVRDRFGTDYFKISDDTFTVNRHRAAEICDKMISERLNVRWQCYTRTDCVDAELARKMRNAGCELALVGIESGSPRVLERIKKGETVEKMRAGIALLRGAGISVSVFLMMGFPEETEEEVMQSLALAVSLKPTSIVANILTPYPGTEIFEELLDKGLIRRPLRYEDFFHQSPLMGMGSSIPAERFDELKGLFLKRAEAYNRRAARAGRTRRGLRMLVSDPVGLFKKFFRL